MTFGFSTLIDLLSWALVLALVVKLVATSIILVVDKDMRDRRGWGSALWWATKITPVVALVCFASIALLERDTRLGWLALAMGVFVLVVLPVKIRERRKRIANGTSARPLARL